MNSKLQILIVDDDKNMTSTLADILTISDHTVQVAGSGREALKIISSHAFDCVLSDMRMPEMDGVEFQQHLAASQPNLPVLLMTAYASQENIRKGIENGAVDVLEKPLHIGQLLGFFSSLARLAALDASDDDPNGSGSTVASRLAHLRSILHQSKG